MFLPHLRVEFSGENHLLLICGKMPPCIYGKQTTQEYFIYFGRRLVFDFTLLIEYIQLYTLIYSIRRGKSEEEYIMMCSRLSCSGSMFFMFFIRPQPLQGRPLPLLLPSSGRGWQGRPGYQPHWVGSWK